MLTFTDTYTYAPRYQELDFWQEDQLLFDIETTGLSAKYNTIYLIGCAYHKGSEITLLQYLAETPAEESEVLEAFLELCKDFQGLLSFNGIRFDERFILDRCQKLQIPTDALPDQHFDIYKGMPRHEIHLKSAILPTKSHRILPWYPPGGQILRRRVDRCLPVLLQ